MSKSLEKFSAGRSPWQHALGTLARAQGMTKVARAAGLSRENLYRSLSSEYAADFGTIMRRREERRRDREKADPGPICRLRDAAI
jgi:hypothetical protein